MVAHHFYFMGWLCELKLSHEAWSEPFTEVASTVAETSMAMPSTTHVFPVNKHSVNHISLSTAILKVCSSQLYMLVGLYVHGVMEMLP